MPHRTPHVLYVDDDPGLARLVQKVMERRGYLFEHVTTGEEGLARIESGGIDVVVLDHYLPSGTGLDVLIAMGRLTDRPAAVYVTGTVETAVAVAALKAGAADYVLKSVGDDFLELLATAVEQAVSMLRLSRAKMVAEREMREARDRAEILLGEVNHRVANSLAMVAALVGLQANAIENEDAKQALSETQMRIQAIAGVHRHLYSSDGVRSVQIADYLKSLLAELETTIQAGEAHARIVVRADSIAVPTEKAASIGVIVTELVTNALKYAYGSGPQGEIRVVVTQGDGLASLRVEDDGVGYDGSGPTQGTGLGSRIVKAMAHGLSGTVTYAIGQHGTVATVTFPTT
jgi:two-component sensor histidine kinase